MRKHVVEYDNVMNKHREILYARRRDLLFDDNPRGLVKEFFTRFIDNLVYIHTVDKARIDFEIDNIAEKLVPLLPSSKEDMRRSIDGLETDAIKDHLMDRLWTFYESKWKNVPEEERNRIEKTITLQVIDVLWMQHIDDMVHLREHVAYRGYAQLDPLGEYRKEGINLRWEDYHGGTGQMCKALRNGEIDLGTQEIKIKGRGGDCC